ISFKMCGGRDPDVRLAPNYIQTEKGEAQRFEFWIHTNAPTTAIQIAPQGDLWRWNHTWPVSRITLEQVNPTTLDPSAPVTLELPVAKNGEVPLPFPLPTGNWFLGGYMNKPGEAEVTGSEGLPIKLSYQLDRWNRSLVYNSSFHIRSPLTRVHILTKDLFSTVLLRHKATRDISYELDGEFLTTTDPARPLSETLVLHGQQLTGDLPRIPKLPFGKERAVLTSWDDGKQEDLRCAEILIKHGFRPTFMLNGNSPALKFIDQLEALGAEIGSHGFSHTALNTQTPEAASANVSSMRKILEQRLGHPVIAFSYPNGYARALDEEGDYVYRALKESGYWIARTQLTRRQNIEGINEPLLMRSNGLWGSGNKTLVADWPKFLAEPNGIFYLKGHSWQIGKSDAEWQKFEDFIAQFAGHPTAWYPSNNEFALWLWIQKNMTLTATSNSADKTVVQLKRPWLHPWLAERCPISLELPAGVTAVTWQGRRIAAESGRVELTWTNGK
ncbi:MAG: polysaccharide deacetylase family protein, partial [Verrucomicrobiales bacterium]